MSVPSSSPYKSRVFTFLNRQSLRLKTLVGYRLRQLKNTTQWGVQILLYPVYLLVQTVRLAERQLGLFFKQKELLRLTSQTETRKPETPIENLLKSVEKDLSPSPNNPQLSQSGTSVPAIPTISPLKVQGIATLLNNHHLVLVSSDNQHLDILSEEQQKQLQTRIYLEIANYWYKQRLKLSIARKMPGVMPSFRTSQENVLLPIRWFWNLMRWEQTSLVAISIDLFGESTLLEAYPWVRVPTLSEIDKPLEIPHNKAVLAQLANRTEDAMVVLSQQVSAFLAQSSRTTKLTSFSRSENTPQSSRWRIYLLIQAAIDYFLAQTQKNAVSADDSKSLSATHSESQNAAITPVSFKNASKELRQSLNDRVQKWRASQQAVPSTQSDRDPFEIRAIIRAAIDYFFAQRQEQSLQNLENQSYDELSGQTWDNAPAFLPSEHFSVLEDDWLVWDDLYTVSSSLPTVSNTPTSAPPQLQSASSALVKPDRQRLQPNLVKKPPQATQKPPQPPRAHREAARRRRRGFADPCELVPKEPTVTPQPIKKEESLTQTPLSQTPNKASEWEDWIETEAKPSGYVKDPLEIILGWLDRIMLWIEEFVIAIWNWIQTKIQQRKRKEKNRRKR